MQLLMDTGASRFLDVASDTLVTLATSTLSDEDMVDQALRGVSQIQFNEMRQQFESMPKQLAAVEFFGLAPRAQQLLRSTGYQLPEEKDPKGILERVFTWDIPLLPEEHFMGKGPVGTAIKIGMAPVRAMGFGIGTVARNVWEYGVMKPSRFATRTGRSLAYMAEQGLASPRLDAIGIPVTMAAMFSRPDKWKEAWDRSRLEHGSFYGTTIDKANSRVGEAQTQLLQIFIKDGGQGVYDFFEDVGAKEGWNQERLTGEFAEWMRSLSDPDMGDALDILESGRLTLSDASVRSWNKATPFDVRPGTMPATVIGVTGSLAAEILLDPTTWIFGFWGKIAKAGRAGLRAGQNGRTIDLWRRIGIAERAAEGKWLPALVIENPVTGKSTNATAEVRQWLSAGGFSALAGTNISIRSQARAINRLVDRINGAFRQIDEIDDLTAAYLRDNPNIADGITRHQLSVIKREFGATDELTLLLRDLPAVNHVIDDMKAWHMARRQTWYMVDEATGEYILRTPNSGTIPGARKMDEIEKHVSTLADEQGFWDFLIDEEGWNALASKFGGVDPEAMWIPKIGAANRRILGIPISRMELKKYFREVLDFDKFPEAARADMARLTAQYLAKQTNYVHKHIWDDIQSGVLTVSKDIDEDALSRIISGDLVADQAIDLGMNIDDFTNINKARTIHQKNAAQVILEDGQLSELLHWYQATGYRTVDGELVFKEFPTGFFAGARKAASNYYHRQIHKPGSLNADLVSMQARGLLGGTIAGLAYYPAKFAEKLTTYVPRSNFLDILDPDTAVREFTALIDMGSLSGMSRTKIDQYLRTFVMGNESERWLVQNEFFLDFIGRSGALVHGGRDVQEFIERFIRYGHQRYANVAEDTVSVFGTNVHRAVIPGIHHQGHLARANVIPNYRELAALTRYMGFYRWAGWGLHLPSIDKFLARTWRPAVLLRLGYVARNGGEEMMSWWLREGPREWANYKTVRVGMGKQIIWDEYGRKILKTLPPEEQLPLIWRPFSRLWRSFNEIGGWGDYAITREALQESIKRNPNWRYVTDSQREALFHNVRADIKSKVEQTIVGGHSRRMFEFADAQATRLSAVIHHSADGLGIPTKQTLARWTGKTLLRDTRHDERAALYAMALTEPTILDAQMRDILGTFDNYLNFTKNNVDSVLQQSGFGAITNPNLKLPMNYGAAVPEWVSTRPGSDMYATDKSIAVTQNMSYMAENPAHVKYLEEIVHYVSPQQEFVFAEFAKALGLTVGENELASGIVLNHLRKPRYERVMKNLEEVLDIPDIKVDSVLDQVGAVEEFIAAAPEELQSAFRKFFEPTPGRGQDPNIITFLFNNVDISKLTNRWLVAKQRAKRAFINEMLTPMGQQLIRSTHRSNVGFDALGGAISEPLPPGATRLFVPMVSLQQLDTLVAVLSGGRGQFAEDFVRVLTREFLLIGKTEDDAHKVAMLLQPGFRPDSNHPTANFYYILGGSWAEAGRAEFPLLAVSTNDDVATAISRAVHDFLQPQGLSELAERGRISSINVNSEELFNTPGAAKAGRSGLNGPSITQTRGGVSSTLHHEDLATLDIANNFFGVGDAGVLHSDELLHGLRKETSFGMAGEMLMAKPDGLIPVQMISGEPTLYRVKIYRHKKDGRTAVLREGDERFRSWYNPNEWTVIDEQIVLHNDLHNAAEELALINGIEIDELFTSGIRTRPGQEPEIFHPWIREVVKNEDLGYWDIPTAEEILKRQEQYPLDKPMTRIWRETGISDSRVNNRANAAGWWDKAPDRLLAFKPVVEEGGRWYEKINRGWNSLLRNWFDGVVNPMIGAMVREPMFQHYLFIAMDQTRGVRRLYHHSDEAYQNLANLPGATFDDDGQLLFDALKGFIESDWQHAYASPDEIISKVGFAIESRSPGVLNTHITKLLEEGTLNPAQEKLWSALSRVAMDKDRVAINEFFDWALRTKRQFEVHRGTALKRAMTLTSAFIDDHRIRSQFQAMVGTLLPFWFAEDQFLRRLGRSLNHNPLMLRNLHLTMNAGVNAGLVQEDQFGEKKLVIPGTEVGSQFMLDIVEQHPVIENIFGGIVGVVARPASTGIVMNIHIIPGYDLDQMGIPGAGPLLAVPMNFAAGRDPSLRQDFEHTLIGGRILNTQDQMGSMAETIWSSVMPAIIARPIGLFGWDGGAARTKAAVDVTKFLAMNGMMPSEEELNDPVFKEAFLDRVNAMAMQYQVLQGLSWFFSPATGQMADLMLHENWEWNKEFQSLIDAGVPYEEAYSIWIDNIEAREGYFDPMEFSPFRVARTTKVPFAVLESTQAANEWLVTQTDFVLSFPMASTFFMPRKFDVEDDEYVSEAKVRQINMGLRAEGTSDEFMDKLYYNAAYPVYHKARVAYQTEKFALRANDQDTVDVDRRWAAWIDAFNRQHPVFAYRNITGTSELRREDTITEFRLLINKPDLIPEGEHRTDILSVMMTIVGFADEMEQLKGRVSPTVQGRRNAIRERYWKTLQTFVKGRPWLNELYYSVFLPLVTDSWLAKYEAGLINISPIARAA
jgi:hypothetical protein